MPIRRARGWHHEGVVLTAGGLAAGLVMALAALLLGSVPGNWSPFGPVLSLLLALQATPIVLVALTFWLVFRLEAVDRRYHRFED